MKRLYVGIDVSKDDFKVGVKDDLNNQVMQVKTYGHDKTSLDVFDRDIQTLEERTGCKAVFGMEATGIYHLSVYPHLLRSGKHVKVFNGLELKRFKGRIRKTKNDSLDALAIAEALILAREPTYHPNTEPMLIRLRELCRLRERLVKKNSQCKNQAIRDIDTLCRGYTDLFKDAFSPSSIAVIKVAFIATKMFKVDLETLQETLSKFMPSSAAEDKAKRLFALFQRIVVPEHMRESCILKLHMLVQQHELLQKQLIRVERRIEKLVMAINPRMLTVPGIGILTAGILLGELGDLSRFASHEQVTAYAGLDPSVMESGRSKRTGHIFKRGSPMLREALYNAAFPSSRVNPVCQYVNNSTNVSRLRVSTIRCVW